MAKEKRDDEALDGEPMGTGPSVFAADGTTVCALLVKPGFIGKVVVECGAKKRAEEVCVLLRDRITRGMDFASRTLRKVYGEANLKGFLLAHIPQDVKDRAKSRRSDK